MKNSPRRSSGVHTESTTSEVVGEFVADIVVEGTIIVELKSVRRMALSHEIQLVNYLVATGKDIGLLLNFGQKRVEVKRKVREL